NKRVIYARDGAGQVVGRKLVGISKDGDLVGFRTYSTLPGDTAGPLWAIFNSYASDFAARCGLRLADEGEVPPLFATWYDDGAVPWKGEAEDSQKPHRSLRMPVFPTTDLDLNRSPDG